MNIKKVLAGLLNIYAHSKGAGHTYAMVEGVKNSPDVAVVVRSFSHGRQLAAVVGNRKFYSLDSVEGMYGDYRAVVFDNFALETIFSASYSELTRLEHELSRHEALEPYIVAVCINGIDKAQLLAALYNAAKPFGAGFLHYEPSPMDAEEAREILLRGTKFDYLRGRVMKVDLSSDVLHIALYERDNGRGAASAIVAKLHLAAEAAP